jgi:hypothetical protein
MESSPGGDNVVDRQAARFTDLVGSWRSAEVDEQRVRERPNLKILVVHQATGLRLLRRLSSPLEAGIGEKPTPRRSLEWGAAFRRGIIEP